MASCIGHLKAERALNQNNFGPAGLCCESCPTCEIFICPLCLLFLFMFLREVFIVLANSCCYVFVAGDRVP